MNRNTRNMVSLLMVLTMALVLITGCAAPAPAPAAAQSEPAAASSPAEAPAEETSTGGDVYKVAYANVNDLFPYTVKLRDYLKLYAEEAGMEFFSSHAENDLNKQVDQVENYLLQGVNAMIVMPCDPDGIVPMVDKCWEQGVPFCTVAGNTTGKSIHVGSLNYEAGLMQADYMAEVLPENGKVLYLHADPINQEYVDRRNGFLTLFEKRPDLELLSEQNCKSRTDLGMSVTETWIQAYPQFDGIVCQNDDSALGAVEALKAANRLEGVYVVGLDGSDPALESIVAGELAATAYQDAPGQARAMIDILIDIRDGVDPETLVNDGPNPVPTAPVIAIPFQIITAENVQDFMS